MPIRRSSQTLNAFSMASMTDVIFLLLIFFMVLSTLVVPNAIKINLPSSQSSAPNEIVSAKITLTVAGECFCTRQSVSGIVFFAFFILSISLTSAYAPYTNSILDIRSLLTA